MELHDSKNLINILCDDVKGCVPTLRCCTPPLDENVSLRWDRALDGGVLLSPNIITSLPDNKTAQLRLA